MLKEKIIQRQSGIVTYGMTPPKESHTPDKLAEIAQKQVERLKPLDIDALILYDVQEEADRVEAERPFPYLPMLDPTVYAAQYLNELNVPKIIYRCVGKYNESQLTDWIQAEPDCDRFSVYVGASSSKQEVRLGLTDAYRLTSGLSSRLIYGGVVIPERHMVKKDEHLRVLHKVDHGCSFFVSQATYNVEATKDFLSDYYYHCKEHGIDMVPMLINIAPCGSTKTLDFMKWLGISIPRWLENDLKYTNDVLDKSITVTRKIFEEIFDFGMEKGIPIGCSVESVSTRRVEIEASIQLLQDIQYMIRKKQRA